MRKILLLILGTLFLTSLVSAMTEGRVVYTTPISSTTNIFMINESELNLSLNDLEDVNAAAPADQDVLSWDDGASEWIPQAIGALSKWIVSLTNGYFYNDSDTIYFNDTRLNLTIDSRAGGDNESWNESKANSLYISVGNSSIYDGLISNASYLSTYNETYATGANASWNQTKADALYAPNTTLGIQLLVNNSLNSTLYSNSTTWWATVSGFVSKWFYKSGNDLALNETQLNISIDARLVTTYYNATQSDATVGTIDGGSLSDTHHQDGVYDGVSFNFSEESGSPGLDLRINFTGIEDFNLGVMRYKTGNIIGDYPIIQLWNYDSSIWEDYPPVGESSTFATITQPVFDSSDHVSGEVVQMRIYKSSQGFASNHYYVDWIAISKGPGTPSGQEVDPYSIHTDAINYTQMNYTSGKLNIFESWLEGLFISDSDLPLANLTTPYCGNITGNATDLCTITSGGGADGNASSICDGGTTYLDGDGNCDDISSVYEAEAHCDEHDGDYLSCDGEELDVDSASVCSYCGFTNAEIECVGNDTYFSGEGNCNNITKLYTDIKWNYNQTTPAIATAVSYNNSLAVWIDSLFLKISNVVSHVGNWTLDKVNYLTNAEVNTTIRIEGLVLGFNSTSNKTYDGYSANLSEDEVEAYIFDNDNTANQNLSGYNLTSINYAKFVKIGGACDLTLNGSICSNATGTYIVG